MKKTAIVTGGARGIGLAISRQLANDGYNVVIAAASPPEKYAHVVETIKNSSTDCLYVQCNVSSAVDRDHLVAEAVKKFGAIHVLVNNAGVAPSTRTDLLEMTEESFDGVVGINTKGTMFMTQAVAKQMLKQPLKSKKNGVIVNISSCSSVVSSVSRGEYCISKAGISMLTKLFADRLAAHGILVFEVRPGVIATDMTTTVKEKYDNLLVQNVFPIARWGLPEDVAGAVSAFCSDQFLYSTGSYIDVDGGFHIQRL